MKATWLWSRWQALLLSLALGFTRRGRQRFVEWVTALALNVEELASCKDPCSGKLVLGQVSAVSPRWATTRSLSQA